MITTTDLGLDGGPRPLFRHLTWQFDDGTVVAVLGPSGAGKTTLLGALAGQITPAEGSVSRDPNGRIAWAQQNSPVLAKRTVLDNVALGAVCAGFDDQEALAFARKAIGELDLQEHADVHAGRLSGGERQRVALARALTSRATVILADEPTASLDPVNKRLVVKALRTAATQGLGVIVATHDPVVAAQADVTLNLVDLAEHGLDR